MPGTAKAMGQHIAQWSPDLVFCHHGRAAGHIDFLASTQAPSAVYLCDEPYETGETAKYSPFFTHVFSMDPCTVEAHRMSRPSRDNVYYLPPAADTGHFSRKPYQGRVVPALFLGNASLPPRPDWLRPIERLVDGADIRFFESTMKNSPRWVPWADHPKLYGSCLVGLNVHRNPGITKECLERRVLNRDQSDPVPKGITLCRTLPSEVGTGFWNDANLQAAHVNPRFFEMAACGTLVVSDDRRSELSRMFPMAPIAGTPERFLELVSYYIENTDEAEAIGNACSILISRRHSYTHRAAEVLIRAGLMASLSEGLRSSLGEPEDWLTPQDCERLAARSSSGRTGPSEPWSPQSGMLLTNQSGKVSESTSIDAPTPWL